jgi:hypothetical protein
MTSQPLTAEQIKNGALIVCIAHPEWGTFRVSSDRNGWIITNRAGSRMLDEAEAIRFWAVV